MNGGLTAPGPAVVARDVGRRLAREEVLGAALEDFRTRTTFPESVQWRPSTLAQGHAGLAVLFGVLDARFPADGWDRLGHAHLGRAVRSAERGRWLDSSLYTGVAGLGFAALTLAGGRERYQRLLATVDECVGVAVRGLAVRLDGATGCRVADFDLISGLTGLAVYLTRRQGRVAEGALHLALGALVRLVLVSRAPLPRWHTPASELGCEEQEEEYPQGNLNCGLAHGIPGPLALLAGAVRDGHDVPGLLPAVRLAADWLVEHRVDDGWGVNWPHAVPLPEAPTSRRPAPTRAGWCYGAPGVARALWLAGLALRDDGLCAVAAEAMAAAVRKPAELRALDTPTFCHGVAGLLSVTQRFARDTGLPLFRQAAEDLLVETLRAGEAESLLGFRNVEPGGVRVEHPGVLDGAAGVALALLAATDPGDPGWDRLFLLS